MNSSKKELIPVVNNATELSEVCDIPIKEILRDATFQVRQKLDKVTVHKYANVYKSGSTMPPVKVARIKDGLVLTDGWHRIAALESLGKITVRAQVVETTAKEARWMAAKANTEHGLPLKASEVREVFRAYVRAGKYKTSQGKLKSLRDISTELSGLRTHNTIRNWMKKDFPKIAMKYQADEPDRGQGGLAEISVENHMTTASDALATALAASRFVNDPLDRGRLIKQAEELLKVIKEGKPWEPEEY